MADHVAGGRDLGAVMCQGSEGRDLEGGRVRTDPEFDDFARRVLKTEVVKHYKGRSQLSMNQFLFWQTCFSFSV